MHPKFAAILHILSAEFFFLVAKGAEEALLFPPLSGAAVCLSRGCTPTNQADGGWELRHVFCAQNPLCWLWGVQLPRSQDGDSEGDSVRISGALV